MSEEREVTECWGLYLKSIRQWLVGHGGTRWTGSRVEAHQKVVDIATQGIEFPAWEARRIPSESEFAKRFGLRRLSEALRRR